MTVMKSLKINIIKLYYKHYCFSNVSENKKKLLKFDKNEKNTIDTLKND